MFTGNNGTHKAIRGALLFLLGLSMLGGGAVLLSAQGSIVNASLSGAIYDKSGAAIPGAKVTLSSSTKGFSRTFTTPFDGRYSFASVPQDRNGRFEEAAIDVITKRFR